MGQEIDLLVNYPRTVRNTKERGASKTEEDRAVARQFGHEFFDGDRRHGYGGFSYHPRFWQSVIPTLQQHFGLTAASSLLDVGCASGYLSAALATAGHAVVAIELDASAAQAARARGGFDVITGDATDPATLEHVDGQFGAIVCGDILEHLVDPGDILVRLRARLEAGGVLVASLPNIAHWTARRELLRGRFPQADHGIFDRTHLRFLTRASARELLTGAGLRIDTETPVAAPLPLEAHVRLPGRARERAVGRRPELLALQFVFTCTAAA